jgi:hypothetical protein
VHGRHPQTLDRTRLLTGNAVHLRPDGDEWIARRGNAHIRPLVKKGYLRAVDGHRSGAARRDGKPPRAYVLVDVEILVKRKGGKVRIALTGPEVVMTREEWREERLGGSIARLRGPTTLRFTCVCIMPSSKPSGSLRYSVSL